MLYRFITLLILLLAAPAWGATYCVRADGTVNPAGNEWADMANANSCTMASTSMPLSGLSACVSSNKFADGDVIEISSRGGTFYITNDPDNRVYLQGGTDSYITYRGESGYNPEFDGGESAGPLFYVTSATQKKFIISNIIVKDWAIDNNAFYCSKATVTFSNIQSADTTVGGTVIRTYSDTEATVNDCVFGGFLENHWIGVHENSVVTMNRCYGYGGKANAVHSIETSAVTINDTTVISPILTGITGTAAFALEGSGANTINRCAVYINKNSYNGVYTGTAGSSTIVNYSLFIFGGTAAGNSAPGKTVGAGTLTLNNCTFYNTLASTTVKGIFGTGAGGDQNFNNCIFYNIDAGGTTEIGYVESASSTIVCTNCVLFGSGTILAGDASFTNTNPITADPLLNNSYGLQSNSPAKDKAKVLYPYASYPGDFIGAKVHGAAPDIGAYEYQDHTFGGWFFEMFIPTIFNLCASTNANCYTQP